MTNTKKRSFFRPATKKGLLSIIFILVFFLSIILITIIARLEGPKPDESFFDNIPLAFLGLLAMISGLSAFVVGLISIIKKGERSIFVFISTFIGMMILWFLIGELFFEH